MGNNCCSSGGGAEGEAGNGKAVKIKRPRWRSEEPITEEQLQRMREEFWETEPHYGGNRVIWDALKAACEAHDPETMQLILDSAGVIVATEDMSTCYDERGARYQLPNYVLSRPVNLVRTSTSGKETVPEHSPRVQSLHSRPPQEVALMAR